MDLAGLLLVLAMSYSLLITPSNQVTNLLNKKKAFVRAHTPLLNKVVLEYQLHRKASLYWDGLTFEAH